jgi:hypothetical protein
MNKAIGLAMAIVGLGSIGCSGVKETSSKLETSCQVDIVNVEVTRHEWESTFQVRPIWTAELKNAENQIVGNIDGLYIWFHCNDGRKLKLDLGRYRQPSYE